MKNHTLYRILSAFALIYTSISTLGETGSYLSALISGCVFALIWWLGMNSHKELE